MSLLSRLLPRTPESLSDMVGVATICLATIAMLWLPVLIGA